MTQYLFSVVHDYENNPPIADPVKDAEMYARVGAFNESIKDQILFMGGLHAPESATTCTVDQRRGRGDRRPVHGVQGDHRWPVGDRGRDPR